MVIAGSPSKLFWRCSTKRLSTENADPCGRGDSNTVLALIIAAVLDRRVVYEVAVVLASNIFHVSFEMAVTSAPVFSLNGISATWIAKGIRSVVSDCIDGTDRTSRVIYSFKCLLLLVHSFFLSNRCLRRLEGEPAV